jgi:hypothetical protein
MSYWSSSILSSRWILLFSVLTSAFLVIVNIFLLRHTIEEPQTLWNARAKVLDGCWRETLTQLGVPQLPDTLSPEALRVHHQPEISNVRFDLQMRRRAFALPRRSNMFLSDNVYLHNAQSTSSVSTLQTELQSFKMIEEEVVQAAKAKLRSGGDQKHDLLAAVEKILVSP